MVLNALYLLALAALCGAVFSLGGLIECAGPRVLSMRRLFRRRGAVRRRKLVASDGAIVLRGIDRLRSALCSARRVLRAPWRFLCAFTAERRLRRLNAGAPLFHEPWEVIDYSAKRARALEQLGPDYLLARPVKRRPAQ